VVKRNILVNLNKDMVIMVRWFSFLGFTLGVADISDLLDHTPEEEYGVVAKNRAEALFRDKYPRLQELKKKYDPESIFNKWFTITPSA
jgi:hypothetical protein